MLGSISVLTFDIRAGFILCLARNVHTAIFAVYIYICQIFEILKYDSVLMFYNFSSYISMLETSWNLFFVKENSYMKVVII